MMDRRMFLGSAGAIALAPSVLLAKSQPRLTVLNNIFWDGERKKWTIVEKRLAAMLLRDGPLGWIDEYHKHDAIFYDFDSTSHTLIPRYDLVIDEWSIDKGSFINSKGQTVHKWKIEIKNNSGTCHRRGSIWLHIKDFDDMNVKLVTQYLETFTRLWMRGEKRYKDYLPISVESYNSWREKYEC